MLLLRVMQPSNTLPPLFRAVVWALVALCTLVSAGAQTLSTPAPLSEAKLGAPVPWTHEEPEEADESESTPSFTASALQTLSAAAPVSGFTIDRTNRNDVAAAFHEHYVPSEGYAAVMNWTGDAANCDAGTVSSEFQDMTLRRVNYYRAQAGLPADITFDSTKNAKSQEAALMMGSNNALSHNPPNTWTCWTQDGADAAGAGNIAYGSYGPGSIDRYMIDSGSNNTAVGHRRWILYSRAREMGHGSVPRNGTYPYTYPEHPEADCLWVIGNFKSTPTPQGVAWPNEGFVPHQIVPDDGESHPRWSYSYPGANFSDATVTMSQGGDSISLVKESIANGYADNTIVWRPSGVPSGPPASDTTYTVTISGITNAPFSSKTYDVTVIDPFTLNDEAIITGPDMPAAGTDNIYAFSSIDHADAYELRVTESSSAAWLEGAETNPAPQVTDNTNANYSLTSSSYSATGSRSFHLATPGFGSGDSFEIARDVVPQSGSQIAFKYRRFYMHPTTKLRVELSIDGGNSYAVIQTIDGQNSSGSSGSWDSSFLTGSVNVPGHYLGKPVTLRFRLQPTGLTYVSSNNTNGLYIDDVQITNSIELLNPTTRTLADSETGFAFDPVTPGKTFHLAIRPELGGHFFPYGPSLVVTSATAPAPPVITSAGSAEGAQGDLFSYSILATNSPTTFGATGLPAGATVDPGTGVITGQIAPGTYPAITISATNAGGTDTAPLTITVLTGYEKWVADNHPTLGAPNEDDDRDTVSNLLEAALLNMNPGIQDASLLPKPVLIGDHLHYTVLKSGVPGLDYAVEGIGTLDGGTWATDGITVITDDATELTVRAPLSPALVRFLRVVVTENTDTTQ